MKTFKEFVNESKKVTINIEWAPESSSKGELDLAKKLKVKIKDNHNDTADITGNKKDIIAFLTSEYRGEDLSTMKIMYPELFVKKIKQGKKVTIVLDWAPESSSKSELELADKLGVEIKDNHNDTADITGYPNDIIEFLQGENQAMELSTMKIMYPELF